MESFMNYIHGEKHFVYGTDNSSAIKKLKRLIDENPDGVEVIRDDPEWGFEVRLPVAKWNYIAKPKIKTRPLTDEERAVRVERLARAREGRLATESQ